MSGLINETEFLDLSKRMISYSMVTSQKEVPVVGVEYKPDITDFWNKYEEIKAKVSYPLTFNTVIMKVISEAVKVAPILNSHIKYNYFSSAGKIMYKDHIDISMPAVLEEKGITFPLKVKNTENKNLQQLSDDVTEIMKKAANTPMSEALYGLAFEQTFDALLHFKFKTFFSRIYSSNFGMGHFKRIPFAERKKYKEDVKNGTVLSKDDIGEGTLTITNWGSISRNFKCNCSVAPIIPPAVLSNAVSSVTEEKICNENEKGEVFLETKKFLPITILWDHRIGVFGDVVPYIRRLDEIFADPGIMEKWI